jgi:hypothetical protein
MTKEYVQRNKQFGLIDTYVKVGPSTLNLLNQSSANFTSTKPSTNQQANSTNPSLPEQDYFCQVQISHFKVACSKRFFAKKKFPLSIDQLKPFLDKQQVPSDSWGNAYRYELDAEKGQATITSSSPDGQFDTADDVSGARINPNNEMIDDVIINKDKN